MSVGDEREGDGIPLGRGGTEEDMLQNGHGGSGCVREALSNSSMSEGWIGFWSRFGGLLVSGYCMDE